MASIRIRKIFLVAIFIVLLAGIFSLYIFKEKKEEEYVEMQIAAAERMERAEEYMKAHIIELGIDFEAEDLNNTGLIGPEFTELTSTPGDEKAKRSALNPEFASAMIRYFHQVGLEKGDRIAIGATGSFPGFVIATLIAATEMGLDIRLMLSVGASMHGATRPEYNVFDIVQDLEDGAFASFDLLAVSPGSKNDLGGGVFEEILYYGSAELSYELCRIAAERTGAELIYTEDLAWNIAHRKELYGDDIKLFINIGGATVNSGESSYSLSFPQGLVTECSKIPTHATRGLNFEYAEEGIPVLNLLNVKQLCLDNNIQYDPVPLPSTFNGEFLSNSQFNKPIAFGTLAIAACIFIWGIIDGYHHRKEDDDE